VLAEDWLNSQNRRKTTTPTKVITNNVSKYPKTINQINSAYEVADLTKNTDEYLFVLTSDMNAVGRPEVKVGTIANNLDELGEILDAISMTIKKDTDIYNGTRWNVGSIASKYISDNVRIDVAGSQPKILYSDDYNYMLDFRKWLVESGTLTQEQIDIIDSKTKQTTNEPTASIKDETSTKETKTTKESKSFAEPSKPKPKTQFDPSKDYLKILTDSFKKKKVKVINEDNWTRFEVKGKYALKS